MAGAGLGMLPWLPGMLRGGRAGGSPAPLPSDRQECDARLAFVTLGEGQSEICNSGKNENEDF